jgi:hypothetical protein
MSMMEWTPEAVAAEVERRHESAQHSALLRQLREARGPRPSWWRRLRPHQEPDDDQQESDRNVA